MDKCRVLNFFFFGWLFASQKKREMHSISRPEFALQTRAFQGSVRTSCYLHSFATLRNWLCQPLQSLPLFKIKKLEIEPLYNFFYFNFLTKEKKHFQYASSFPKSSLLTIGFFNKDSILYK